METITMNKQLLKQIILEQNELPLPEKYTYRHAENYLNQYAKSKQIVIISGVRRCGKSTLMQHFKKLNKADNFINFEDDRLVQFELQHFQLLYEVFLELFG